MSTTPWYCRYGIHGDISRQTNIDGTAIYRTRERPCDCTPPVITLSQPSLSLSVAQQAFDKFKPQRPSGKAANRQRRPRNVKTTQHIGANKENQMRGECDVPPRCSLTNPLSFYNKGLRVVVPPLDAEQHSAQLQTLRSSTGETIYPVLPSIPVVWPQPDFPTRKNATDDFYSPSIARIDFTTSPPTVKSAVAPSVVDKNGVSAVVQAAASAPAPSPTQPLETPLSGGASLLPPPLAQAAVANPQNLTAPESMYASRDVTTAAAIPLPMENKTASTPCTAERHALHARWGIAYCSGCGASLQAAPSNNACTPETCPLGPHISSKSDSPSNLVCEDRYCLLCGADLKLSPVVNHLYALHTNETPELDSANCRAADTPAVEADLLTRRDLQSVDEIMAHLLRNANAHGGEVQPPCGLPNCRLCIREKNTEGTRDATGRKGDANNSEATRWWEKSFMCGSPAVAIIHNHYYK